MKIFEVTLAGECKRIMFAESRRGLRKYLDKKGLRVIEINEVIIK